MSTDLSHSRTAVNLMRAFAGESQARNRYTFAADEMKKKGYYFLYNIFTFTANQEKEHAKIFYDHLMTMAGTNIVIPDAGYPVDISEEPEKLLRAAEHNEYEEFETVYPAFAEIAREEGFAAVAHSFEMIARIEETHGKRFGCFAKLMEDSKLFTGSEDTEWLCLNCGNVHKGNPPERCPVCAVGKGYFVPYKYYCFIAEQYGIVTNL